MMCVSLGLYVGLLFRVRLDLYLCSFWAGLWVMVYGSSGLWLGLRLCTIRLLLLRACLGLDVGFVCIVGGCGLGLIRDMAFVWFVHDWGYGLGPVGVMIWLRLCMGCVYCLGFVCVIIVVSLGHDCVLLFSDRLCWDKGFVCAILPVMV